MVISGDGLIVQRLGYCPECTAMMAFSGKPQGYVRPHPVECYSPGFPVFSGVCAKKKSPDLMCKPLPHNRCLIDRGKFQDFIIASNLRSSTEPSPFGRLSAFAVPRWMASRIPIISLVRRRPLYQLHRISE
jgi:hypothetical protein